MGQTPFPRVVSVNPFVDFPQYIVGFIWSEASQVRHSVASSVKLLIEDRVPIGLILYSSRLIFIFRDLSLGQVFQDRVDPARGVMHGHDVVDRPAYAGLRKELNRGMSKSIICTDASLARPSTSAFSTRGTCSILNHLNRFSCSPAILRYTAMFSPLA